MTLRIFMDNVGREYLPVKVKKIVVDNGILKIYENQTSDQKKSKM
jgi:hypothetical protein